MVFPFNFLLGNLRQYLRSCKFFGILFSGLINQKYSKERQMPEIHRESVTICVDLKEDIRKMLNYKQYTNLLWI